jgi:hypothetical protein
MPDMNQQQLRWPRVIPFAKGFGRAVLALFLLAAAQAESSGNQILWYFCGSLVLIGLSVTVWRLINALKLSHEMRIQRIYDALGELIGVVALVIWVSHATRS